VDVPLFVPALGNITARAGNHTIRANAPTLALGDIVMNTGQVLNLKHALGFNGAGGKITAKTLTANGAGARIDIDTMNFETTTADEPYVSVHAVNGGVINFKIGDYRNTMTINRNILMGGAGNDVHVALEDGSTKPGDGSEPYRITYANTPGTVNIIGTGTASASPKSTPSFTVNGGVYLAGIVT